MPAAAPDPDAAQTGTVKSTKQTHTGDDTGLLGHRQQRQVDTGPHHALKKAYPYKPYPALSSG